MRARAIAACVVIASMAAILLLFAASRFNPSGDDDRALPASSDDLEAQRSENSAATKRAPDRAKGDRARVRATDGSAQVVAPPLAGSSADVEVATPAGGAAPVAVSEDAGGPNPFGERNPEKLRAIAEEMHVGETVIGAVLRAEGLLKQTYTQRVDKAVGDEARAAVTDLTGYGVEGYRGVLAMLRTGYQGTWFVELVKTTYQPGYEAELIAVANDDSVAEFSRWSALESLQVADTTAVREFLRSYLVDHNDDEGLFMSAALALGALQDSESAHFIRGKLFREGWSGVQQYLITALGGMGGDDARELLVAFIRDERAKRVAGAFRALARFDVEAARDEADRLFDSPRGKTVAGYERELIEAAVADR